MRYTTPQEVAVTPERVKSKLNKLRQRAKDKGLECDLTTDDVRRLLLTKTCYYTKARLVLSNSEGRIPDNALTIDRIDCNKGYVKGNVVACSFQFNAMKGALEGYAITLTPAQFVRGLRKLADIEERYYV